MHGSNLFIKTASPESFSLVLDAVDGFNNRRLLVRGHLLILELFSSFSLQDLLNTEHGMCLSLLVKRVCLIEVASSNMVMLSNLLFLCCILNCYCLEDHQMSYADYLILFV